MAPPSLEEHITRGTHNKGTVFRIDKNSNETVLHSFWGGDGAAPDSTLVSAGSGIFYGTTAGGVQGSSLYGTVFRIDSTGKETVLYRFTGETDGADPLGGLVLDGAGNLYGTTVHGGDPTCQCGVVFKIDSAGAYTVLHAFVGGASDGVDPDENLVLDTAGNLYGTTPTGGSSNVGVVFKVDALGEESVFYSFSGGSEGANPTGLLLGSDGNLYGAAGGGAFGAGIIFKLVP